MAGQVSGWLGGRQKVRWSLLGVTLGATAMLALPGAVPAIAAVETGYNPKGLPTVGCFWTGPFTAADPRTNAAYPGTEITYWGAKFTTPPGAVLTLRGKFPHARYSSFNAYENNGASASSLSDRNIRPDRGSINPSLAGADRSASKRSYTVTVRGEEPPSTLARNTLYAEPQAGSHQDILYRVYVPDRGRSNSGGTGIPVPVLRLADGRVLQGQPLCDELNSIHDYKGNLLTTQTYETLLNSSGKDPATNPALPEFSFFKYFNLVNVLARYRNEAAWQQAWENNPDEEGTQYNNSDARYMTGAFSFQFGEVQAVHGRMPTTPITLNGNRRTGAGQLLEWDMCSIQSLVTTKTYRCLFDEQVPMRSSKRHYVILVSKAEQRPSNARRECGVAWLPADPEGDGAGRTDAGQLLTRNVLPSPGFKQSIWSVTSPFDAREKMGDFYPKGSYMDRAAFESKGCPFRWR
ncbi:MAG: hypothetical protein WD181_05955 [Solirubrobacterales bacterium]